MIEFIILWALLGLIPAVIAQNKGRSFGLWWFYGAMIFIVALPHSIIMSANKDSIEMNEREKGKVRCPSCAEFIMEEAKVCRYCSKELV